MISRVSISPAEVYPGRTVAYADVAALASVLNRAEALHFLSRQANEDADLEFSQAYLWIAVLIDSRVRNEGRYTNDGPDSRLRSAIQNTTSTAKLHTRIGLIRNEFVQRMDRPPFELTSSGLSLERLATAAEQPPELT